MPWKETDVLSQRVEFVVRSRSGEESISDLCREFEVSRKTGHKWLRRFSEGGGFSALSDRSRRPRSSPNKTPKVIEDRVVELRQEYGWSGPKLHELMKKEGVEISAPTIDRIIKRRGLVSKEDSNKPATKRFERSRPNELWQMDFKGEYLLPKGGRCYPLSVLDDHSRYAVGVFALTRPNRESVQQSVERCFEAYGLPEAMLMDHGTPWWNSGNEHGLTRFSVGLIKQGINLIYGSIGHPQTQGKVERFHRTMKHAMKHRGVPQSVEGIADALRHFRQVYNEIRPHEALDMDVPSARYRPSPRPFNPYPPEWEYPEGSDIRRVNPPGSLHYRGRRYHVSKALVNEWVWCREIENRLLVTYRHMYIRQIELDTGRTTAVVRPVLDPEVLPKS
jgi:transposase InsO family protein